MTTAAESLLEEALQLPAADRALVATGLLASLDPEQADEAAVDQAWGAETDRRAQALDAGTAALRTWDHLVDRVDARRSSLPDG